MSGWLALALFAGCLVVYRRAQRPVAPPPLPASTVTPAGAAFDECGTVRLWRAERAGFVNFRVEVREDGRRVGYWPCSELQLAQAARMAREGADNGEIFSLEWHHDDGQVFALEVPPWARDSLAWLLEAAVAAERGRGRGGAA